MQSSFIGFYKIRSHTCINSIHLKMGKGWNVFNEKYIKLISKMPSPLGNIAISFNL